MGLAQTDDPLVMRIIFEVAMMWPNVGILHCKSWYLWERNRFIGKLPRICFITSVAPQFVTIYMSN